MRIPFLKKAEPPKRRRRTRAYIATTDGNVFPYAMLKFAEIQKSAVNGIGGKEAIEKASDSKGEQGEATAGSKLANKPYDPALFFWMKNNNIYLWRCVIQLASDIAGTGWTIKQKEGKPEKNEELDKILALMEDPNWEDSIEELWQKFLIDRNLIGYAGMEVVRDIVTDEAKELWHIGSSRIWLHKDKKTGLFAEKNATGVQKNTWFYRFGMVGSDGKSLQVSRDTGIAGDIEYKDRAHEIMYSKIYYPESSYYGAPPIAPASGDVVLGVGARDYNLAFVVNYGVPALLITLSGEWDDDVDPDEEGPVEIINRELKKIKGVENAHGTIVVETPEGCEMTVVKLAIQEKEGSFSIMKADVAQDVMVAYGMPPYRIRLAKTGSLAGNVATPMLETYISGVVEPGQRALERMMDRLYAKGLGVENYELSLKNLDLYTEKEQAEIAGTQIRTGQKTPNQIRRKRGEPEYIGGDTYHMESSLIDVGEDDTE